MKRYCNECKKEVKVYLDKPYNLCEIILCSECNNIIEVI